MTRLPWASTCAVPLGPTTAVDSRCSTIAGPWIGCVHRQAVMIVDGRLHEGAELVEIDRPVCP